MSVFFNDKESQISSYGEKSFSTENKNCNNALINRIKCYPLFAREKRNMKVEKVQMQKAFKLEYTGDFINYAYVLQKTAQLESEIDNFEDIKILNEMRREIYSFSKLAMNMPRRKILNDIFISLIKYTEK